MSEPIEVFAIVAKNGNVIAARIDPIEAAHFAVQIDCEVVVCKGKKPDLDRQRPE